jgi:3'-5' exoribonuclease 1
MNYIILDLEATCWRDRSLNNQHEIIEIGAVKINGQREVIDEFNAFIKPKLNPQISEFCNELTTIEQTDIDGAGDFKTVISEFWNWIDLESDYLLFSWGFYDKSQFTKDCELHQLSTDWVERHISLKHQYAQINSMRRPTGMKGALRREKIELDGTHHKGIDDARNISKIFLKYFDNWSY